MFITFENAVDKSVHNSSCKDPLAVADFNIHHWLDEPAIRLTSIVAPTRSHLIGPIRDFLVRREVGIDVRLQLTPPQICMAVEEALANAIYHGNLEISSQLKEDGSPAFWDLAKERQSSKPWMERVVRIQKLVCQFGLWITITDEGAGFDTQRILNQTPDPMEMLSSGRGLIMMRAFTNDLFYNACGNSVTMAFYSTSRIEKSSEKSGPTPVCQDLPSLLGDFT